MFLSKIWFILVGLAAGVATTAAFVAPRAADRRIFDLEGERLDRAQYAAEQMLKADAHSWIDYVTKLSRDANLSESLDAASKGVGEARLLSETVRGRLKALVPNLAGIGLQSVGAVDIKGRLVARLGDREQEQGESVAGIEVIADALRGYLSDDVWGATGTLQRVAAVPVLSKARDRIVGALWVGAETGKRLAEVWKQNLGVDIAIMLRGQVTTSTVPESFLGTLPAQIEERKQQIKESKRTRPIGLTVGSDRLLAVAAPFVGQAGEQGGMFALIGKVSPASNPLALLKTTTADDLRWGNFPWLGLAAVLIVILGVGLFLQRIETERPLGRLREEVQRLARGELQKLNDTVHPGKFGGIARDVNAAMERFTLAAPPRSEAARKDVGAILGPAPPQGSSQFSTAAPGNFPPPAPGQFPPPSPGHFTPPTPPDRRPGPASVFDLPQSHFDSLAPPPTAFQGMHRPGTPSPVFLAPGAQEGVPGPIGEGPAVPEPSPPRGYGGPPTLSAAAHLGATPERRLMSPQLQRPPAAPPPPPPPPSGEDGAPTGIVSNPFSSSPNTFGQDLPGPTGIVSNRFASAPSTYGQDMPGPTGIVSNPFSSAPSSYGGEQATSVGGENAADARSALTAVGSPASLDDAEEEPSAPVTNGGAEDPLDDRAYTAHVREVFEAYVATRRRCGETVATLTLDKFQARLETNRQQLVAKYGCRSARFSVYIKDGKAAVKATPLR